MPVQKDPITEPAQTGSRWPMIAATVLLAAGVAFILTPQQLRFFRALEEHRQSIIKHPETRDYINLGYYRALDQQLPPDARIFFTGFASLNNRLFPYYYARSILYPREVEISVDHKAAFHDEGFVGVDYTSPEQLRTNGYDLILKVEPDNSILHFSLTKKGELK